MRFEINTCSVCTYIHRAHIQHGSSYTVVVAILFFVLQFFFFSEIANNMFCGSNNKMWNVHFVAFELLYSRFRAQSLFYGHCCWNWMRYFQFVIHCNFFFSLNAYHAQCTYFYQQLSRARKRKIMINLLFFRFAVSVHFLPFIIILDFVHLFENIIIISSETHLTGFFGGFSPVGIVDIVQTRKWKKKRYLVDVNSTTKRKGKIKIK